MKKVFGEFFLDGAKIIFGSVVVAGFISGIDNSTDWTKVIVGVILTVSFIIFSGFLSKKERLL